MTTLSAGQSLGHYTILGPLDAGAMGEVWRAQDTRLGREVAVKVLPSHFVDDEERLRRFEREARSLASLNHPCVAQIHAVDQIGDHCFLVLELVPGETLGERIARGPLPPAEALALCARIADGLEAAHEAGVIHRDLKPDNVRVTPHGEVKLLDFGLARPVREKDADASTDSVLTTEAGRLLGTPTYMAPEQARGRPIDRRVDVWAFGCVLYECLTGRRAFTGESLSDVLAAVLQHEPDYDALPPLPPSVAALLRRCLVKDPRQRLRDVGEARLLFDDPSTMEPGASAAGTGEGAEPGTGAKAHTRAWRMIAAVTTLAALVASVMLLREPDPMPASGPLHVTVEPPPGSEIVFSGDFSGPPVVSPDGSMIVFSATSADGERQLWLRRLDELEPQALPGTQEANFPFWSPDCREIGFFAGLHLCRLDLASGAIHQVADVLSARGGAFTGDGRIVYAASFRGGLSIVDVAGGAPTPLTTLDDGLHTSHRWPSMVAGTDRFVFNAVTSVVGEQRNNGIYLGSLEGREPPRRVLPSDFSAQVVDGWLLYAKDSSLLAERLELDSAQTGGQPLVLAKGLAPDPSTWHAQFSASPAGVLAWRRRNTVAKQESLPQYSWSATGDRVSAWRYDGGHLTTYATGTPMFSMALSPDGSMLAMDALSPDGFTDIVVCPTRFGLDQASEEFQNLLASPAPPPPRHLPAWRGVSPGVVVRQRRDRVPLGRRRHPPARHLPQAHRRWLRDPRAPRPGRGRLRLRLDRRRPLPRGHDRPHAGLAGERPHRRSPGRRPGDSARRGTRPAALRPSITGRPVVGLRGCAPALEGLRRSLRTGLAGWAIRRALVGVREAELVHASLEPARRRALLHDGVRNPPCGRCGTRRRDLLVLGSAAPVPALLGSQS
jgi:tRNA A-37 threonylcarbamoyl transferase component Bud32